MTVLAFILSKIKCFGGEEEINGLGRVFCYGFVLGKDTDNLPLVKIYPSLI
jgi:hypothetical protein